MRSTYLLERFHHDTQMDFMHHCVLLAKGGSRAYNTFTEESDYDFTGIVAPPAQFVLGLSPFSSWEPKAGTLLHEVDGKVYGITKAVLLLLKGNPNMLELLWYPRDVYEAIYPTGDLLIRYRHIFSSKHVYKSLANYASAQFDVMLRGTEQDRLEWDDAVTLTSAAGWTVKQIVKELPRPMPNYPAVTEALEKLPGQMGTTEDWPLLNRILTRSADTIKKLNYRRFRTGLGAKRKKSVMEHGYDPKNASHLVRLLYLGRDFAEEGILTPWMTGEPREHVMEIKAGLWELDRVKDLAHELWKDCETSYARTSLPDEPDEASAEELLIRIQKAAVA